MFEAIKKWAIQRYIEYYILRNHQCISQVLFDYKHGLWETIVSGACNEENNGVVQVWIDHIKNHGQQTTLIWMVHSDTDGGFVVAINNYRQTYERFFLTGLYDMSDAFKDVGKWCEGGSNGQTESSKT